MKRIKRAPVAVNKCPVCGQSLSNYGDGRVPVMLTIDKKKMGKAVKSAARKYSHVERAVANMD